MAFTNRTKISEYDATAANNINLGTAASPAARLGEYGVDLDAEAMRPSDTNGALRELMKHLKDMDAGTSVLTSPKAGQFLFDTTYTETGSEPQGSAYWNSDEETLDLVQNGAVLQLGQETQIHVRNNSATVTITNGTAVMAVGTVGASGRIKVDPMDADDATTPGPKYFLGIATEDILGGSDGKVTVFGKVRSLNTSTYSEGDVLWCDPVTPGALTATTPSAPDLKIAAGYVVTSDLNNGVIFVRANAGIDLHENHRVQILSPDAGGNPQTDKMLLCWNNSAKRWENQTAAQAGLASLSGAEYTGPITVPQGSLGSESIVISGSTTDFGLYNTGAGLVVSDGTNISFMAYSNEIVTYIPVRPSSDSTGTLGTASIRYSNVYSINGTFNSVTINGNNDLASFLSDPTSAKLATAVTDETGSGALVFGTAPTLSQVHDDSTISYNGTDYGIGYRSIPAVSTTGAVTASAAHNGKCITANGTITVPSTLAVGTVISVWVNSASTISIAKSGGTMYLNGTSVSSVTADAYGIATIYFPTSSTMVVTGNVS